MSEEQNIEEVESVEVMAPNVMNAIESAQINQQIATAKRYPRNIDKVAKAINAMVSMDEDTAASCFYSLPRGGKNVEGPSVRMAEIAVSCYGNLRTATRIVEEQIDGPTPHVKVQAVVHDLESNVACCIEKRRRITKKNSKPRPDEDDLNLAVNACSAIAFRDAAFKVIPGVMIKKAMRTARQVAVGDAKSLSSRVDGALAWFLKIGVSNARVLEALGRDAVASIVQDDLATLTGYKNAIADGVSKIEEVFPVKVEAAKEKGASGTLARAKANVATDSTGLSDEEKAELPL